MGNTEGEAMKYKHVTRDEEPQEEPKKLKWWMKVDGKGKLQVFASDGRTEQIMYVAQIDGVSFIPGDCFTTRK